MPPTLAPTGSLGKSLANLAWLVASSATFQTLVGALDATSAMGSVYVEADDLGAAPRPRAIVFFHEYRREKIALSTFAVRGSLFLSFEFPPSAAYAPPAGTGNVWDEYLEFCNRADAIVAEMEALQGQGSTGYLAGESYLSVSEFELLDGPSAIPETKGIGAAEARDYFFGCTFAVHRFGQ